MMNNEFNILLRIHLKKFKETPKIKTPRWLYPLAIEKVYAKEISKLMKEYINKRMLIFEPELKKMIQKNKSLYKNDAFEEDFRKIKKELEDAIIAFFGVGLLFTSDLSRVIESTCDKIMVFSLEQWKRQTEAVLGDPYNSMPPDWIDIRKLWIENNYENIKGLAKDYNSKFMKIIETGIIAGWLFPDFLEEINILNGKFIGQRSAFIARNQAGNLVDRIISNYALGIGNDEYIWQTALDEKVRGNPFGRYPKAIPSHWAMEGKICKWSDSSVYSNDGRTWLKRTGIMPRVPPGYEENCRCTAGLYWGNFIGG